MIHIAMFMIPVLVLSYIILASNQPAIKSCFSIMEEQSSIRKPTESEKQRRHRLDSSKKSSFSVE